MRRFLTVVALIAGTLVPAIAVSPIGAAAVEPAAPGGVGIRLVDAPVDAKDDPRARVYIVDHLNPGAVITRRIEVSNGTTEPASVSLYTAAADIKDGTFLGAEGRTPNELSTWTTVEPASLELQPGAKQMATVTVTVPADAAPGEQYGVVWSEVRSASQPGAGVTQVSRVGIRLYVDVGPGGPPAANFTIDTLTAERAADGRPVIRAAVHNTGGRAIDLSGTLRLTDGPGGLSAGPFPVDLGTTVGIGGTASASATLDPALPAGPWNATLTMKSGLIEVSAQATITFPDTGSAAPVSAAPIVTASSTPGWLYPTIGGVAVLLVAVIVLLLISLRRRGKQTSPKDQPAML